MKWIPKNIVDKAITSLTIIAEGDPIGVGLDEVKDVAQKGLDYYRNYLDESPSHSPEVLAKALEKIINDSPLGGFDNSYHKLKNIAREALTSFRERKGEGETICVFCSEVCEIAPTKRGWSSCGYLRGLHFDCAGKVADQGNIIDIEEKMFKGEDPNT
jgi:hypothetical protein